jgi:hypothetical protein
MTAENYSAGSARRRAFLKGAGVAGAALTAGMLASGKSQAQSPGFGSGRLPRGDVAILQMALLAELIESDLWTQYAELGGLTPGQLPVETASFTPMNNYQAAFMNLDQDGPQYISSNTADEVSHATFLSAYLTAKGVTPLNLAKFATLPSSKATGAKQIGRLTNLLEIHVDSSWYTRYRSSTSPDFGFTYAQALPQLFAGKFPVIPASNADFGPSGTVSNHIQAIANAAAFHFGSIEQGGTSLYAYLSQKAQARQTLEITLGIGGDEICHFLEWVDFAGNSVQPPLAPITDPTDKLVFPNFDATVNPLKQTNLIFPVPATFIDESLPKCAVIRPITSVGFTAVAAIQGLIGSGLFAGQPAEFMSLILDVAAEADAAERH